MLTLKKSDVNLIKVFTIYVTFYFWEIAMKRLIAIASFLVFGGTSVFASGPFTIPQLQDASKLAIHDFSEANTEHVEHFVGYKTWISGDDAKVKIYVTHEGADLEFN